MSAQDVVLGFMGDVMLGRLVNDVISAKGYSYPWGNVLPILKQNDCNIINLETALTRSTAKVSKIFNFKADPDKVQTLRKGSIHIVNQANNHSLDFSVDGLAETLRTLDDAHIHHVGAGMNIHDARKPVIVIRNGIKIGVVGFTDNEPGWEAGEKKPGTNYVLVGDIAKIKATIQDLRTHVDLVVATIHWGPNMRERPTPNFVDFAHHMIDCGVDIIHGHSAHVVQGIELYKGKLIMYDTGDFVDDYMVGPELRNDQSFLFLVTVGKEGVKNILLVPVLISDMQVNKAQGRDYEQAIKRMKMLCEEFGTKCEDDVRGLRITIKLGY